MPPGVNPTVLGFWSPCVPQTFLSKETHEPIPGVCRPLKTKWVLISKFFAENTLKTALPISAPSSLLVFTALPTAHSGSDSQQLRPFSSVNLLFAHYSIDLSIFPFPRYFSALEIGEKTGNNAVSINKSASWE